MTVSAQTPYSSQAANGVTTSFPFAYKVRSSTDIVVVLVDASGNETVQTLGVHYTVSGVGSPSGGAVNFLSAPAAGLTVKTYRVTGLARAIDYQNNGDLLAAVLNGDVDAIWLALQELVAGTSSVQNALRARAGETLTQLPGAAARADRLPSFDGDGDATLSNFTATQVASVVAAVYAAAAGPLDALSFLQAGLGAISMSPQTVLRQIAVTLEQFGGVGDGATDDSNALNKALATGRRIRLRDGATYRITSAQATASPLFMSGEATIMFAFVGIGLSCTGSAVEISGVTFDGNDQCHRAVYGSGQTSVLLEGCTVKNVYGTGLGATGMTTGVRFESMTAGARVRIVKCSFIKMRALSNGVEGDNAGAVRAIYLRDSIDYALIDGCYFEDVNDQDGAGVINNEDAEAIQCQTFTAAETQYVTVQNCHFTNCGKRAAKFQTGSSSVSRFVGNTVISAWTVPAGSIQTVNNSKAMFCVVSVFGGTLVYANNLSTGGVISYMINANDSVADLQVIHATNNVHTPMYSAIGFTNNYPARYGIDSTNPRGTGHVVDVIESGNYFTGQHGRSLIKMRDFITFGNYDTSKESTFRIDAIRNLVAMGNVQLASPAGTEPGYEFRNNAFNAAAFSGNILEGFYDAIYFGAALTGGSYRVTIGNTVFRNSVRNDVSEFTLAADKLCYSYTGINTTKATNAHYALRGTTAATATTGASGALPAQVAGYETVVINAATYKRPLYNV